MATNQSALQGSSRPEIRSSDRIPATQEGELEAIELALTKASRYAELLNDTVIEYFVDMALTEVRARRSPRPRSAPWDRETGRSASPKFLD